MTQSQSELSNKKRSQKAITPVQLPETGFLRKQQVLSVLNIGQTSLREGIIAGVFPAPIKLSPRLLVWDVAVIRSLIEKISKGEITLAKPSKRNKGFCVKRLQKYQLF